MQTLAEATLLTVGYEGRTADELVDVLAAAEVDVLVDVRLTPLSRKPGLSKRRLAEALDAANIQYVHLSALGNPSDNREGFRRGEPSSRDRFRALLQTAAAQRALEELRERVTDQRVALLCFERDADCCHRQLVSDYLLSGHHELEVVHL